MRQNSRYDSSKDAFTKAERLNLKQDISALFNSGIAMQNMDVPARLIYRIIDTNSEAPVKVLISIPRKTVRKASRRNKLKRMFRETYRRHKHELISLMADQEKTLHLAFIWQSDANISQPQMESKIILTLDRLKHTILKSL